MAEVELITGPAGSGKTARVREAFRAELAARQAEGRFGTALWITPTQRSRQHVSRSLLSDDFGVCFAPRVVTFDEFAEALLRSAPEAIRPLSRVAKRKLLRDLIDDLHRRRKLKYFGAVAGTAGFLELCVSFISELKREEVWPEDFERGCERLSDENSPKRKRGSSKDRELALIYDAYQRRLHAAGGTKPGREAAAGLYDGEGRFWSARTLMRRGHRAPFRDLTLVVVDGFTDFTRTQYEMLAELASWTGRMLVTLPLDPSGRRDDLFAKSAAAADEIRKAFGGRHDLTEVSPGLDPQFAATAFGHVSAELFANPRDVVRKANAVGLTVLSCVRRAGEIEEVAKRVKRLLVGGAAADEIVVAFRSLDGIAELVRETFGAAGVPAAIEVGPAIARTGAVRLLVALLDLERENWSFPKLTGVLNSTLFRPEWAGIADGSAARAVAATLRAYNLEGGREVILTALVRRVERQDGAADPALLLALETLQRLSDELAFFRQRATFAEWVERLLHVASELRVAPEADERITGDDGVLAAQEAAGWRAFVRLVEEARKAETLSDGPARPIELVEFRKQLDELLAGQTWETEEPEDGRVRVLAAAQVRNLDVPHLFLCGLSESSFPQSRGEDCLYGDAERHRLSEGGLPMAHRARRSREEMLLFYGVATRARQSLTLSFPSVDDGGEPLYPSPYLQAVRDLFTPEALPVESCGRLSPVPEEPEKCVTECDLRVVAAKEALDGRVGLFAAVADRRESAEMALNVAAAAEMAAARFATRGLTNYEGLLSDPRNLKRLRLRFGGRHEFSVTELEAYAAHPFRYLLYYVLGLEALADPGPGTDFARRGSVLHAALAAAHRRLTEDMADTTTADVLDRLLRDEVEKALRSGGDSPLQRALHRIEREILAKHAGRYRPQWDRYTKSFQDLWDGPPKPSHFEVAFGNPPPEEGEDPGPRRPVVEFGANGERVRVRGRIDRIDLGSAAGATVFNVIDYKLSRKPARFTNEDIDSGRALQLALYAAAARRLGLVDGDLYQLAFWSLTGDGFVCGMKGGSKTLRPLDAESVGALEENLDRVLPLLADSIRAGKFPVVTDDPEESYNADYAAVARTGPFRSVAEVLEKRLAEEEATGLFAGQGPV